MQKFSALDAMERALVLLASNWRDAVKIALPWFVILIAVNIYIVFDLMRPSPTVQHGLRSMVFSAAVAFMFPLLIAPSLAVKWHRTLLLKEPTDKVGVLNPDPRMWRYVGNGLLVIVFVFLPIGFVAKTVLELTSPGPVWLPDLRSASNLTRGFYMLGLLASAVVGFTCIGRLALKLPAISLERRDYGFASSWKDSSGQTLSLMSLAVLAILTVWAPVLASDAVFRLTLGVLPRIGHIAMAVTLHQVIKFFGLFLAVTLLSLLYASLVERREL